MFGVPGFLGLGGHFGLVLVRKVWIALAFLPAGDWVGL